MSNKNEVIKLDDKVDDFYKQHLFISSTGKQLISITDKVMLCGIPAFLPVMMDFGLWKMYHKKDDTEFRWLNYMLGLCSPILDGGSMNIVDLTFAFDWEPEDEPQFIRCYPEINNSQESYLVLTITEGSEHHVLH